jgi:hypothetical protein
VFAEKKTLRIWYLQEIPNKALQQMFAFPEDGWAELHAPAFVPSLSCVVFSGRLAHAS